MLKYITKKGFCKMDIRAALIKLGFTPRTINHNLSVSELYNAAFQHNLPVIDFII